jgi:hypothetical protein
MRDRPADRPPIIGIELHSHADRESSKLRKTSGRSQKLQTLDDAPVQLDEFVFGQLRQVWKHEAAAVYQSGHRTSRQMAR